jgi:hypothetical protein
MASGGRLRLSNAGHSLFTATHLPSIPRSLQGQVTDLAARTAADGMSALALADTNALYGMVAFAKACRAAEVRPIIGMAAAATRPAVQCSCGWLTLA